MEQKFGQANGNSDGRNKKERKTKMQSYWGTFMLMLIGLAIMFSYVYQSTKQVYLNYEIVNKNKEINNLNIKLMESKVENERLQTNENIEKVASEKLGMSYEKSDRIVVIKESETVSEQDVNDDKKKIKIFLKSLYEETFNQLSQLSFENILNYFKGN